MLDKLTSLPGFNLNSLGGNPTEALGGFDPMALISSLFGNESAAQQGQPGGDVCNCGGSATGGACTCGGNCCQQNEALGF